MAADGDALDIAGNRVGERRHASRRARRPCAQAGRRVDRKPVLDPLRDCEAEKIVGGARTIGVPSEPWPIVTLSTSVPAFPLPSGLRRVR